MKNLTKALVGTVAAGAMAVSTASPALARDRDNDIDTGDVIAGALVIGGIAAVAAAASKDNRGYDYGRDYRSRRGDRYRHGYGRGYGMHPDQAVQLCASAVQQNASRYAYGRADITRITSVRDKRDGFDVKGRLAVDSSRYGSHYRGYGYRGYDSGNFTCKIRYGRIVDIDYSGIRGLG